MGRRIAFHLSATTGVGIVAMLLGGMAHALIIVPVWRQLDAALPYTVLVAGAMSWAVPEVVRSYASPRPAAHGLLSGVLLWAGLLPTTAYESALRLSNSYDGDSWIQAITHLVLAFGSGFVIGRMATRNRRGSLSMGVATAVFALVLSGSVPVSSSWRSLFFFLSILPVTAICGSCVALLDGAFEREPGQPPQ